MALTMVWLREEHTRLSTAIAMVGEDLAPDMGGGAAMVARRDLCKALIESQAELKVGEWSAGYSIGHADEGDSCSSGHCPRCGNAEEEGHAPGCTYAAALLPEK